MLIPTLISRMLEPFLVILYIVIAGFFRYGIPLDEAVRILGLTALIIVLPPALLLWLALKRKLVSDWDISVRPERVKVLVAFLPLLLIDVLAVRLIGSPLLTALLALFALWFAGYFAVTLIWKISGHSGATALWTALMVYWFGMGYVPLLLLVPVISWARVRRKNHTVGQVIAGAVFSFAVVAFAARVGIV